MLPLCTSNDMGESTEQAISITWYPLTMQRTFEDNIEATRSASIGFEKVQTQSLA